MYSLFNGFVFTNGAVLKFRLAPFENNEPQPEGPILEVKNLPNRIDHDTLYDLFRRFGPLSICKPITEDGAHRGKALVQFFYRYDSDVAMGALVSRNSCQSKTRPHLLITVTRTTSYLMEIQCKSFLFFLGRSKIQYVILTLFLYICLDLCASLFFFFLGCCT